MGQVPFPLIRVLEKGNGTCPMFTKKRSGRDNVPDRSNSNRQSKIVGPLTTPSPHLHIYPGVSLPR